MHTRMKKRSILSTFLIGIATCIALFVFITTFQQATGSSPFIEPEIENVLPLTDVSVPTRLIVPTVGIDANVQHVGISKSGRMAVPTNYTDVGWYKYGSLPGEAGTAVMAGHLDNGFGQAAVFKQLEDLKPGDVITIQTQGGQAVHFKVRTSETFSAQLDSTDAIFVSSGVPQLKLITCEGEWDKKHKTYTNRRVVTADLIS
jgi:LPXTG-site transpeptidase (sortase) family protein